MEEDDWLRRGILVSNLPTSDDVTIDKLEIHFSKRANGGGDVQEIIMLDDFKAMVKFKEEKTVETVLAKNAQRLLDSILMITRYTMSDVQTLKTPVTIGRPGSFHDHDDSDGLESDGQSSTDHCTCKILFQIFEQVSVSIPFRKLQSGLLEPGKPQTLNRIQVQTGVKWHVDQLKQLLLLTGKFEEIREAAAMLQNYTIDDEISNGVEMDSNGGAGNEFVDHSRFLRPSSSNQTTSDRKTERGSPEPNNSMSVDQLQRSSLLDNPDAGMTTSYTRPSFGDERYGGRQTGFPKLKLRDEKPENSIHKNSSPLARLENPPRLSKPTKTTGSLETRSAGNTEIKKTWSPVAEPRKAYVSATQKEMQYSKIDVARLDPKLLGYIITIRKSELEEIEKRFSVHFITTENGNVTLEVKRDANMMNNIKNGITEFQALRGKIQEKDPEPVSFDFKKWNLSDEDLIDICRKARKANPEITVTLGDDYSIQIYGIGVDIRRAEEWMSEIVSDYVEEEEAEDIEDEEEEEEDVEDEEGEDGSIQANVSATQKETQYAKIDVARLDPKLLSYIITIRKSELEEIEKRFSVHFITTENGNVTLEVKRDANMMNNIKNGMAEFQALRGKIREKDPEPVSFDFKNRNLSDEDLIDICRKARKANPEITVTLGDDYSIQIYGIGVDIRRAEEWMSEIVSDYVEEDEEDDAETGEEEEEEGSIQEILHGSDEYGEKRSCDDRHPINQHSESKVEPMSFKEMTDTEGVPNGSVGSMIRVISANHTSVTSDVTNSKRALGVSAFQSQPKRTTAPMSASRTTPKSNDQCDENADTIENRFDQKKLDFLQATRYAAITALANKHHVDFEMKGNGIVQIRKRNTEEACDTKMRVAFCALTSLVNSLKDLGSQIVDLRDLDVPQKIMDQAITKVKQHKDVLIIDGMGCKVEFFGCKVSVQTAVDNFKKEIGEGTEASKTNSTTNGSSVKHQINPGVQHRNYTVPSAQNRPGSQSTVSPARTPKSSRPSTDSDDATKKPVTSQTSKVIEQVFDQKILDYIQAVCYEEINKIGIRHGVDFEMKGNGVVQVRQRNGIAISKIKMRVGTAALKLLVDSLDNQLQSHTIDLRNFDVPSKVLNEAITEAKHNKHVLVVDGPGCKVELLGTKDKLPSAVDSLLKVIKSGKVGDTSKVTVQAVGTLRSRGVPSFDISNNKDQPGRSERKTSYPTGVNDFQTAHGNDKIFHSFNQDRSSPPFVSTQGNGIWGNDVEKASKPMGSNILRDPRNYLELNDAADGFELDDMEVDGEHDETQWYDGELTSIVQDNGLPLQRHQNMYSRAVTATEHPMTGDSVEDEVRGAYGDGGAAYFDDSDDDDDDTSPGGLLNDISAYGDLDDDMGQPVSNPVVQNASADGLVLNTSAGFDIEIQQGDITLEFVSVIVTSADPNLGSYTGVGRAIKKAGGHELAKACNDWVQLRGPVDSGKPVYTTGGNLTCSQVLHVVPPDVSGATASFGQNPLSDMMQSILKTCHQPLKATSIAMPAIAIDTLQIRKDAYARYLFEAILNYIKSERQSRRRETVLQKLKIVDKNASLVDTLRQVFTTLSTDPTNRHYFQPPSRGSSPSHLPRSQSVRHTSSAVRPKQTRRNRSWDRDRPRNRQHPNRNAMFRSERLTRSTMAATFDAEDDFDDFKMSSTPMSASSSSSQQDDSDDDKCPICLDTLKQPKTLKCKHKFCKVCLAGSVKHQGQTCPVCKEPFGSGKRARTMPSGNMDVRYDRNTRIPGYPDANGAIVITYKFTSGVQGPNHPNPGRTYSGATRTAYLPDNPEGRDVLNLLKRAFDSKLTFTVGTSSSTGQHDVIIWNDIHHKTSPTGGSVNHGYPDPTYLARVRRELEDKGIR